jgi:autotransporter-associated beta strand protein
VTVGNENINLNGGKLATSVGTSSLAGNVALGADSEINVTGTQLTIAGQISGVAYDYVKTGAGRLVLSGNNTYTGRTLINVGMLRVTSTGNLGANANNLVISAGATLDLQTALTVGSLNMETGANIRNSAGVSSLTLNGVSLIAGNITTSGNQTYNNELRLVGDTLIQSTGGSVLFNRAITAPGNTKNGTDLTVLANGSVTINGNIGENNVNNSVFRNLSANNNINNLTLTASRILINANILTMVEQTYNGAVIIGDNGTNGTTRTLLSLDPKIHFNGTVDDAMANIHTLIARAVSVELGPTDVADMPRIIFGGKVGGTRPLYALQAITGVQSGVGGAMPGDINIASTIASPFTMIGQIIISDSVTTLQDQTYVANAVDIGGVSAKLILTTDKGIINIYAGKNPNLPVPLGIKAVNGTKIALKGKFSRETANSFKASGVKFAQDNLGGYVDAALANVQSKAMDKVFLEREARVVVGAALKMKDGKISSFDESTGDSKSNAGQSLTTNCMKDISEECQK